MLVSLHPVHWYDHVQPFTTNRLCELVEIPSKGDSLYNLKDGVLNLFEMAYRIILYTDLLILQRLNTDDTLKESVLFNTLIFSFTWHFFLRINNQPLKVSKRNSKKTPLVISRFVCWL